jgi:FkbM family methyltransferase
MARIAAKTIAHSLRVYHGDADRNARLDALYARFVKPDHLAFDVGSHVGDRVSSFRRLGARVVAVEPQQAMVTALRILYGRDRSVSIEAVAVGRAPGRVRMLINAENPTVSTVSPAFGRPNTRHRVLPRIRRCDHVSPSVHLLALRLRPFLV